MCPSVMYNSSFHCDFFIRYCHSTTPTVHFEKVIALLYSTGQCINPFREYVGVNTWDHYLQAKIPEGNKELFGLLPWFQLPLEKVMYVQAW